MNTTVNISEALSSLLPDGYWSLVGDAVTYHTGVAYEPTSTELATEVTRLQAEYDSKQYQRDRAEAYPSLTEQADMAYWDRQNGTTTLDDAISAVKAKFPKPKG